MTDDLERQVKEKVEAAERSHHWDRVFGFLGEASTEIGNAQNYVKRLGLDDDETIARLADVQRLIKDVADYVVTRRDER